MYDKIRILAAEKNISITKLEEILGFSNGTITKWNNVIPRADNLKKVADYFGVSIEYFLDEGKA